MDIGCFYFLRDLQARKRADERTRTADLLITSELLYQLSYVGLLRAQSIPQGRRAFTQTGLTQSLTERSMLLLFFDGFGVPERRSAWTRLGRRPWRFLRGGKRS
jgi:hypothetical protein